MLKTHSVVAIYHTNERAEKATQELQDAGVSLKSLSIAAKDTHTEEHALVLSKGRTELFEPPNRPAFVQGTFLSNEDRRHTILQPKVIIGSLLSYDG